MNSPPLSQDVVLPADLGVYLHAFVRCAVVVFTSFSSEPPTATSTMPIIDSSTETDRANGRSCYSTLTSMAVGFSSSVFGISRVSMPSLNAALIVPSSAFAGSVKLRQKLP